MNFIPTIKIEDSEDETNMDDDVIMINENPTIIALDEDPPMEVQNTTDPIETRVLLQAPFFRLNGNLNAIIDDETISAKCCNCEATVLGTTSEMSSFLRHLRRQHLEVYYTFVSIKSTGCNTFGAPEQPQQPAGNNAQPAVNIIRNPFAQPRIIKTQIDYETRSDVSHSDITQATVGVSTVYESLFSEIMDLKEDVRRLRTARHRMQTELMIMDRATRRNKLIFYNVKVDEGLNPSDVMLTILKERLQLYNVPIRNILTVSRPRPNNKFNIMVEFAHKDDAMLIMKNSGKLRTTGIFVEPDISKYAQKRKYKLMQLRKELMRLNNNLKVLVRSSEMHIGPHQFFWDDEEGLSCLIDGHTTTAKTATERLKEITGVDLTEFLTQLHN